MAEYSAEAVSKTFLYTLGHQECRTSTSGEWVKLLEAGEWRNRRKKQKSQGRKKHGGRDAPCGTAFECLLPRDATPLSELSMTKVISTREGKGGSQIEGWAGSLMETPWRDCEGQTGCEYHFLDTCSHLKYCGFFQSVHSSKLED